MAVDAASPQSKPEVKHGDVAITVETTRDNAVPAAVKKEDEKKKAESGMIALTVIYNRLINVYNV